MKTPLAPPSKLAFSRVELMAVVAGLALMAILILPALAGSRAGSHGLTCLNNLRQLGLAWLQYAKDNGDQMPPNNGNDLSNAAQVESGVLKHYPNTWCAGWLDPRRADISDNTNTVFLERSHLFPYVQTLQAFKCPSDQSVSMHGGKPHARVRTVSMNNWMGSSGGEWAGQARFKINKKTTDLVKPSPAQTWVLIDELPGSVNDSFFAVDMTGYPNGEPKPKIVDYPSSLHRGGATLCFADGRAELRKWVDSRTIQRRPYAAEIPLNVPSPGNADVVWLQGRTTGLK